MKSSRLLRFLRAWGPVTGVVLLCSSCSDDEPMTNVDAGVDNAADAGPEGGTQSEITNALAGAYPQGLSISALPEGIDSAAGSGLTASSGSGLSDTPVLPAGGSHQESPPPDGDEKPDMGDDPPLDEMGNPLPPPLDEMGNPLPPPDGMGMPGLPPIDGMGMPGLPPIDGMGMPAPGGAMGGPMIPPVGSSTVAMDPPQHGGPGMMGHEHPRDQLAADAALINGEAESCFSSQDFLALTRSGGGQQDICFQFDIGMIAGSQRGTIDRGRFNPIVANSNKTVEGILTDLEADSAFSADRSSEACMVIKGREKVEERASKLRSVLAILRGSLCQAQKDGLADSLPDVGSTLDLSGALTSAAPSGISFSNATLARLPNQDGRPVFQTVLEISAGAQGSYSGRFDVVLTHSPADSSNNEYVGSLKISVPRVDDSTNEDFLDVVSMNYEKSGTTPVTERLRFEVRDGSFNTTRLDAERLFGSDGRVDFNSQADENGNYPGSANDYSEGMGFLAFDINPSTYEGIISFWTNPGGNYQEQARGFVFEVSQSSMGGLDGCSWAGAANGSIRQAIREDLSLVPQGCSTPQIQQGGQCTGAQIWKQCFFQDGQGIYRLDTELIVDDQQGYDVLPTAPANIPEVEFDSIGTIAIP